MPSTSKSHGICLKKNTAGMDRYLASTAPQGLKGSVKTTSKELTFRSLIRSLLCNSASQDLAKSKDVFQSCHSFPKHCKKMYSLEKHMNMSPHDGIKLILCVGNSVEFYDKKVLCLDVQVHLRSNDHCLVTPSVEFPHGLPHAEPVAALHGDHQHLPSLGPSPDAHTEQDSSQHLPPKLQPQGHLHTNQKQLTVCWAWAAYICFLALSSSHLQTLACHWRAMCPV